MSIGQSLSDPRTYDEKKQHSQFQLQAARGQGASETIPPNVTERHIEFAKTLSPTDLVRVSVLDDDYGLYGWCSDGVLEKMKHDGGSIVFGWTLWEWPGAMLTAEFHSVWRSPDEDLCDITPKPQGEMDIVFVPDLTYPQDFDFDKRPHNRRFRLYQPVDAVPIVEQQIARMKPSQLKYEIRRAEKARQTLNDWLLAKQPVDRIPGIIDNLISATARREEALDSIPGTGFITPTRELLEIQDECKRLIQALKAAGPQIKGRIKRA
jgi:hypothetical protein